MRITSKEIEALQQCQNELEMYADELQGSGYQKAISYSRRVKHMAMWLDKFIAKIMNSQARSRR